MSYKDKTIHNIRARRRVLPDVQSRNISDDDYVFQGPSTATLEQEDRALEKRARAKKGSKLRKITLIYVISGITYQYTCTTARLVQKRD